MANGRVENLVKEIQKRENLKSMKQVFEVYPYLGELYYRELQGEKIDPTEFTEEIYKKKKNLLLG